MIPKKTLAVAVAALVTALSLFSQAAQAGPRSATIWEAM